MKKNYKKLWKELKIDLEYILNTYDEVYDHCGGFCEQTPLNSLLENPSYKTAYEIMLCKLRYYFYQGYDKNSYWVELPVEKDKKLQEIKRKWLDDKEENYNE